MSMHDTVKSGLTADAFAEQIIGCLQHMLPTTAIRRSADDEIAIEDEAGNDWTLIVSPPPSGYPVALIYKGPSALGDGGSFVQF